MTGGAWNILKCEAIFLLCVGIFLPVNLAQKHGKWTRPQAAISLKLPVNYAGFPTLRVLRKRLYKIVITFEMTVDPPDLKLLHAASLFSQ